MNILVALVLNALALLATAYIVPGFHVDSFVTALITGVILGLINTFIRPILTIVSAPITILTLGLFSFVINAVALYLATLVVPGFKIDSITTAIIGGVVLAVVSTIIASLAKEVKKAL